MTVEKANLNLTGIVKYLNEKFKTKENGTKFNAQDVQQYIRIGNIPRYLGNYSITRVEEFEDINLYNLNKED